MWVRPVGATIRGENILVAIDAMGEKHMLVPTDKPDIPEDHDSQGVSLTSRTLRMHGKDHSFVDVHCKIFELEPVFEQLLEDMVNRLVKAELDAIDVCRMALDDWRSLFKEVPEPASAATMVGLVGELEVLRLLAPVGASRALDSWVGPTGTNYDFSFDDATLEVKSIAGHDGSVVSVSSAEQLDPHLANNLHLAAVHLIRDETAPSLDDRIRDLISSGVPRGELLERVAQSGYVYGTGDEKSGRYTVRSFRLWKVDRDFPGIRASDIPKERLVGVSQLVYRLDLDAAPKPMDEEDATEAIRGWIR